MQGLMDQKKQDALKEKYENIFIGLGHKTKGEQQKILSSLILSLKELVANIPDVPFLHETLGRAIREIPFSTDGQLELMEESFEKARHLQSQPAE